MACALSGQAAALSAMNGTFVVFAGYALDMQNLGDRHLWHEL